MPFSRKARKSFPKQKWLKGHGLMVLIRSCCETWRNFIFPQDLWKCFTHLVKLHCSKWKSFNLRWKPGVVVPRALPRAKANKARRPSSNDASGWESFARKVGEFLLKPLSPSSGPKSWRCSMYSWLSLIFLYMDTYIYIYKLLLKFSIPSHWWFFFGYTVYRGLKNRWCNSQNQWRG